MMVSLAMHCAHHPSPCSKLMVHPPSCTASLLLASALESLHRPMLCAAAWATILHNAGHVPESCALVSTCLLQLETGTRSACTQ